MPTVTSSCKECGKLIEHWPSQKRQYCSTQCRGRAVSRGGMPTKPKTGQDVACEVCGSTFWRMAHQVAKGTGRFCSRACHDQSQRIAQEAFDCEQCGTEFSLSASQAAFRSRRFCSKACEGLGRIKRPLDREHNGKPARLDNDGYVWLWEPDHPKSRRYKGWMAEHRLVAEVAIGRPLRSIDEVHHINRNKQDNRPENLSVLDGKTHARLTAVQRMSDARLPLN